MRELRRDKTERKPGRRPQTCRICGVAGEFETYLAREMMQGTEEEFPYFVCDRCKCLQIETVPENLGDYYGSGYYSFQMQEAPDMEFSVPVSNSSRILDVGCGSGAWLVEKAMEGWGNLYGCDPFLENDRRYGDRVFIRNCTIHEMEGDGAFDIIHMSDSFEHMQDPLEVLKSARRLLKEDGVLYMKIPTYPNIAFEKFGPHWYQLDAPRHIFLHSKESLEWLARAAGMSISDIRYDSNNSQFVRSLMYEHGIPFHEQDRMTGQYFSRKELAELDREAAVWNEKEYGDHMEVCWKKSPLPPLKEGKTIVFQRFRWKERRRAFPYPPLYREPDADYICFTDDPAVHSSSWKVRLVESLETADLEPYLGQYANRVELQPEQIQMGPLYDAQGSGNLVTVPALEELPFVHLEADKLIPTADEKGNYIYRKNPPYRKGKYNGRPLLLTIGVPVSNQIGTIERCLSHIKPLLDGLDAELLVIDTGSTDGTVEVCRRFGARIISHPWCDNMSVVRNEGIYHAMGQWYMSIDDDEWFEDVGDILDFFRKGTYRNYDAATYIQRNYLDSEGNIYEDNHTTRMAAITPELHFEGRIHDALVLPGHSRTCMLQSYAHHYGFIKDSPERVKEKFMRNVSILVHDVYEYPSDLRYLFQLANEYTVIKERQTAVRLFALTMALAKEAEEDSQGKDSMVELLHCLYNADDPRLFTWAEYLKGLFSLTAADQAGIAWIRETRAFYIGKPAWQALAYYDEYKKFLEQYRADPGESRYRTFYGLALVENESYPMEADALAFCSYQKIDEEEKALELLPHISLSEIENVRPAVLLAGLSGGEKVYDALCAKLTAAQWEEWSGEILRVMAFGLTKDGVFEQQCGRMPQVLARLSVPAVISWLGDPENRSGKMEECLQRYAIERDFADGPVQESCLCAWILKDAYMKKRGEEDAGEILYRYLFATAVFAERYYGLERLMDAADAADEDIPPDIRTAYRMAAAFADGMPSSENVALLKQALEIYPAFHEEIRMILAGLGRGN